MRKYLIALITLFIVGVACSSLRSRDVNYTKGNASPERIAEVLNTHKYSIVAIKRNINDKSAIGSGVCIGYATNENLTYVVSAHHVLKLGAKFIEDTESGITSEITSMLIHKYKDMGLFTVKGKFPITNVYRGTPKSDYDIIIGYIDGDLSKKLPLVGRAVPGQSGGGVFSNNGGFFATVSTTGDAVETWSALVDLSKTDIIGIK